VAARTATGQSQRVVLFVCMVEHAETSTIEHKVPGFETDKWLGSACRALSGMVAMACWLDVGNGRCE
jgi:hypothetical protein